MEDATCTGSILFMKTKGNSTEAVQNTLTQLIIVIVYDIYLRDKSASWFAILRNVKMEK
jgi:hypothetical protein